MKLLSIDTSTERFSSAVSFGDKVIKTKSSLQKKWLESRIIPQIRSLLASAQVSFEELDGFVVGLGPGSFTSLRVGLSTIKGFSLVTRKKIVAVSSLDAIAMNIQEKEADICVISDARRGLVYAAHYHKIGDELLRYGDYSLLPIMEVVRELKHATIFIGDGIRLYHKEITKASKTARFADKKLWFPQARRLAYLGIKKFRQGQFENINTLVPLYLYADDCQVQKKSK